METSTQNGYGIPVAIVIAGFFIAGAVFWASDNGAERSGQQANAQQANTREPSGDFRLPNESDHVRGNPDAKVAIIEFSDFECPFCAQLHPTLKRLVDENTEVKWVYRHFPLSSIHSRALGASVASECMAKLGGNDAFWAFADSVFAYQRSLGDSQYEALAVSAGIDASTFKECLADKSIAVKVAQDGDEAVQAGGRGTPFVVVVTASGRLTTFSGALPYEQVSRLIDQAKVN